MIPDPEMIRTQELAQAAAMVKPLAILIFGGLLVTFPAFVSISNLQLEHSRRRQRVTPEQRRLDSVELAYKMGELEGAKQGEKRLARKLRKSLRRSIRRRGGRKASHRSRLAA